MLKHTSYKRVRYGETDQMGYLYHGNYAQYYEIGRVELLRSLGLSYKLMEDNWGVMMPVVSMSSRYLRPGKYDDLVAIETQVRSLPAKQITFHYELSDEQGKMLNGGRVVLCFVKKQSGERIECPDALHDLLLPHFA